LATLRLPAATLALLAVLAGPASAGTVSGKLAPGSAKLPRSAKAGEAQVLALGIDTLAYGDASRVARNGAYKLDLPAGKWALRTSIAVLGEPYAAFTSAAIVTKAGGRRSLPLTAKKFKQPRKKKRSRPHVSNVNPRDGRSYPGEAYGIEKFSVTSADADFSVLANGLPDMLTTDLLTAPECEFTLVEWRRRDVILDELALQRSEYVDPASRVEPGHLIDPEILIRGRVEDRPGTPKRLALVVWLADAKTGARLSGDVSSVTLPDAFFASEERLAKLVQHDLICARTRVAPPAPAAPAPAAAPAPPPPSPPVPTAATNVYTGSFSGEATSELPGVRQTWSGTVRLDAAQDLGPSSPPPNGAPRGSYRTFTATSGSIDVTVAVRPPGGGCALDGTGHIDLVPGFLNQVIVQLDAPNPAYVVAFTGMGTETVQVTKSGGPECSGTSPWPVFSPWASTGTLAHTASSFALDGFQSELTPEASFDYDYTTRWSLSPG
jgi:hypothetical protein